MAASVSLSCVQSQYNKTKQGISQSVEAVRPPRHLREGTGGRAELGALERDIYHKQEVHCRTPLLLLPSRRVRKEVHVASIRDADAGKGMARGAGKSEHAESCSVKSQWG